MPEIDLNSLSRQVLGVAFVLSALLGAITQRTHFCAMGAIADIVNTGDWTRMRMWIMALGVAMIGFNLMAIIAGAVAALQFQIWRIERAP